MKLGRTALAVSTLALGVTSTPWATAQTMTEMTPLAIRQAIEAGRGKSKVKPYGLKKASKGLGGCDFLTPFLQVEQASSDAAKNGRPFGEGDVGQDALASVVVWARTDLVRLDDGYWHAVNAIKIVISKDGREIAPSKVESVEHWWPGNARIFNATPIRAFEEKAVFPRDVVGPGSEILVTYQTHSVSEPSQTVYRFEAKQYK
jgi:hypothetical protein